MSLEHESLPQGWTLTTIEHLSKNIQYGLTESAKWEPTGIQFLRITDIQDGQVDWESVPHCKCSDNDLAQYRLEKNDIVFARTGATTGKSYLLKDCPKAVFASYLIRLRLYTHLNIKYFAWFLQSPMYWSQILTVKKGSAQPGVNATVLSTLRVPLAPHNEQTRIVEEIEKQFSRLDAGVAALKRVQANLKRYRASVLKAACEGRLVPTEAELARQEGRDYEPADALLQRILIERCERWEADQLAKLEAQGKLPLSDTWKAKYTEPSAPETSTLPALPEGWCWANVGQIASLITKGSSPNWQGFDYCEQGIVFVRSQNVLWGKLDLTDVAHLPQSFNEKERKSVLRENDILLNIVGASIGRAAIATSAVANGNVNQAVAVIRLVKIDILNHFLLAYLNSPDAQKRIHAEKVDVARANFSLADIEAIAFPLPPLAEQERIVAEVERRLSVVEAMEKTVAANLKRAERLRQAILQRAFSGKLVPQDPNDEPASVLLERIRAEREANATPPRKSVTPKAKPTRQMTMNLVE